MEPATAVWVPCDFQLANWNMVPAQWIPGMPVHSASTEMLGSCLQTSLPVSSGGQLVEHAAATQCDDHIEMAAQEFEVDFRNMDIHDPIQEFKRVAQEFEVDIDKMKKKIHRYPPTIQGLKNEWFTVPTMVAIGPYHHGRDSLKPAEKVKHVAAYQCIRESGHSVQEMYDAVVSVADEAHSLYDKDVVAGLSNDDFLPMMFYDACFLVQFMLMFIETGYKEMDPSLLNFFDSNMIDIRHDVMLLENQLPWLVVEAVMRFRPVPLEEFIGSWKECLQDKKQKGDPPVTLDDYEPPHLLGLLRHYIVGGRSNKQQHIDPDDKISYSASAIELAEIGIALTASETTELIRMDFNKDGTLFPEVSVPPLSVNHLRISYLVNMAALELCTTPYFLHAKDEDSAVCSYLSLLAVLMDREDDVHQLRAKHLLQGGGGLNNEETLQFFTSLQNLRIGRRYFSIMQDIQNYKETRPIRTRLHSFVYNNKKTILMGFSAIGGLVSVLETLKSLKVH